MPLSSDSKINTILFANTAAVIAVTAELRLLLRVLLLPLSLPLCGGLFQNIYCCKYCICQYHCYCYYGRCHHQPAVVAACRHYHCGENRCKSTMLHIFISFCFIDDNGERDGRGNSNDDGNGNGDDLSLFVLCKQWDNSSNYIYIYIFSWWKCRENLFTMKEMEGERGRGCCCFCNSNGNGNGNGYADNNCKGNNNSKDWLSFASWKQWDYSGDYIYFFLYSMKMRRRICEWQREWEEGGE
jgi:hypothetical protein